MNTLHELLENGARSWATNIAVEDPDCDVHYSYRDLDRLTNELKCVLIRIGISTGDRVGIYAPKSVGTVASIFGILKAGAAYVPVDPLAPPARNAFILQDCDVRAVIVEKSLANDLIQEFGPRSFKSFPLPDGFKSVGIELVLVATVEQCRFNTNTDGLAYILYTSGSTGKPKGVMHTHSTALSFIDWCSEVFKPSEKDRFSSHAPFHFDLSILDVYVSIKHGSTLVLIGEDLGKQPGGLAQVISERHISMWYSTPSVLRLLVEYGQLREYDFSSLRIVNFAGEVYPIKHLQALIECWPHPRYFNLYGPTETNVCTYFEVTSAWVAHRTEPVPIGRDCSGDISCVIDADGNIVPSNEEGELLVAGGSVMTGYWNRPNRTEQAFYEDGKGFLWYKTGDIVRKDDKGNYVFVGRRDRMVKRRGYRVELGEIEAAFYRHPSIEETAVIAIQDEEDGVLIKAFLRFANNDRPSLIKLKRFAAEHLPLYMVPDRFSFPEFLPKTTTDKIDYKKLEEFD